MAEYTEIPIGNVKPGMFIEFKLAWFRHPFYTNSFRVTSPQEIETLIKAGIRKVKYYPARSYVTFAETAAIAPAQIAPPPPQKQSDNSDLDKALQQKQQQLQALQKRIDGLEQEYKTVFNRIANIEKLLQSDIQAGVKATHEFVSHTVNDMVQEMELFANMITAQPIKERVESTHRLNVCYLCLVLGSAMGLSRMQFYDLGTAAILHDIGKTKIPREIMLKHPPYTLEEKQFLEAHPLHGVKILYAVKSINKSVLDAVYQHHERLDGTGYPRKLTALNIALMARIIAVADTYDNICNRYYLKRLLTPHESLSYMYTRLRDGLSIDIIETFVKTIGVYPPGCFVELSDGNIGIVIATNKDKTTRPTIIVYNEDVPKEKPIIINMSEEEGLTIVRSIIPVEVPEKISAYLQQGDNPGLFLTSLTVK
jgi:HD-GYP domain-containing protein (c-di-GMP phosphodiesterase class II)